MQHPGLDSCIVTEKIVKLSCTVKSLYFTMAEPKQRYLVSGYNIMHIFTGCNEGMAKVIFLHLFVILYMGGFYLNACWDTNPPGPGKHPPGSDQTPGRPSPLDQADPPQDQTPPPPPRPGRPPQIRHTPRIRHHHPWIRHHHPPPPRPDTLPPRSGTTSPGKQTPAYGLRAAGTHPTGMHSCYSVFLKKNGI